MKTTQPKSIDEYIAGFPAEVQQLLQRLREVIRKEAPEAVEAIKYQMPTFVLGGNLVHFAAYQRHIGFYPTPSAIQAFRGELSGYVWAKGSVQFPLGKAMPLALIRKMVAFRVAEVRAKAVAKRGGR